MEDFEMELDVVCVERKVCGICCVFWMLENVGILGCDVVFFGVVIFYMNVFLI